MNLIHTVVVECCFKGSAFISYYLLGLWLDFLCVQLRSNILSLSVVKAYFNYINHIIAYTILTSTKFCSCPYNFRKYRAYCELVKFGETYELTSTLQVPLLRQIYTILPKTAIFRERICVTAPKFLQQTQTFCSIRCTNIRLFKGSEGCNTGWQQDNERMSPFRNLSGVP